ncbi:hypothetical protein NGRA_1589 [Nosema granulosis]|uniref:Uncharacterized protein n=1 Tax=Nosema granulosis TaxID=83296 RepID=A0A9P6KYH3_9MICR|nr:hypothetical protein NGRA_1589 [Nosema granulosis]
MKHTDRFFLVFLVIYYSQLITLVKIISKELLLYSDNLPAHNDVQFISFYELLLAGFEFFSVCKYCIGLQIEGLIYLLALKIDRYLFLFTREFDCGLYLCRFLYVAFDLIFVTYFVIVKDSTFVIVLHQYNVKIGLDVKVRNSFIVSID